MITVLLILISYFVGAIPTGYLIARLKGITDIREHGSGNIGATNVARLLGTHYFFLVFLLDAGKAYLFLIIIAPFCSMDELYVISFALLVGNSFSLFLRGRGGKGIATTCGILLALQPMIMIPVFFTWLLCLAVTHTVGIASVVATLVLPLYALVQHDFSFLMWAFSLCVLIVFLHRKNVRAYF